jgi:hypothetical protein
LDFGELMSLGARSSTVLGVVQKGCSYGSRMKAKNDTFVYRYFLMSNSKYVGAALMTTSRMKNAQELRTAFKNPLLLLCRWQIARKRLQFAFLRSNDDLLFFTLIAWSPKMTTSVSDLKCSAALMTTSRTKNAQEVSKACRATSPGTL